MNIDKRRNYFLVLDTETTNNMEEPLVYDIGFLIIDSKGHIYEKENFLVKEIFNASQALGIQGLMESAYYASKIPLYEEKLLTEDIKIDTFYNIRLLILHYMELYKVTAVCAYNTHFDRLALNTTLRYLTKSKYRWFFPYETQFYDIWNMACQVLFTQKTFIKHAIDEIWYNDRMNVSTNAETAFRYISQNNCFDEEHTALSDAIIESIIFLRCLRQHKKMDKGINRLCWRIPQPQFKKALLGE